MARNLGAYERRERDQRAACRPIYVRRALREARVGDVLCAPVQARTSRLCSRHPADFGNEADSSFAVRSSQCHTGCSAVGRIILVTTVRRAWTSAAMRPCLCATSLRTAPIVRQPSHSLTRSLASLRLFAVFFSHSFSVTQDWLFALVIALSVNMGAGSWADYVRRCTSLLPTLRSPCTPILHVGERSITNATSARRSKRQSSPTQRTRRRLRVRGRGSLLARGVRQLCRACRAAQLCA